MRLSKFSYVTILINVPHFPPWCHRIQETYSKVDWLIVFGVPVPKLALAERTRDFHHLVRRRCTRNVTLFRHVCYKWGWRFWFRMRTWAWTRTPRQRECKINFLTSRSHIRRDKVMSPTIWNQNLVSKIGGFSCDAVLQSQIRTHIVYRFISNGWMYFINEKLYSIIVLCG